MTTAPPFHCATAGRSRTIRCQTARPCRRHAGRRSGCFPSATTPACRDLRSHPNAGPHGKRAWERFTPDGPLALLPWATNTVVFTAAAGPGRRDGLDDDAFVAALQAQFGRACASPNPASAAASARLRLRDTWSKGCGVWIGNTARPAPGFRPGFNLGLRDAWQLAGNPARPGHRRRQPGQLRRQPSP